MTWDLTSITTLLTIVSSFVFVFHFSVSLIICSFLSCLVPFFFLPSHTLFSCCGCCLCCKSSSKSPSDRIYWMEQNSCTYTCPACQKLEQEELKWCNKQQPQLQEKQQQYEAQLSKPPSSQQHPELQHSLPHPAPFETLIT